MMNTKMKTMTTEFKVGDKVVPKSSFVVQDIRTIKALGEHTINGYPAWVTSRGSDFGQIIDLEYMKVYFEPGFFQLKYDRKADVVYKTSDPGPNYRRVTVVEDSND